jgi:hypothetical protein
MKIGYLVVASLLLAASCDTVLRPLVGCPISQPVQLAGSWVEIGGPRAHFARIPPEGLRPNSDPYLVITRVEPDPEDLDRLGVYLERLDGTERIDAFINSRMLPAGIQGAPNLPGGWFLVELTVPESGCWRIVAAVDDVSAGSAVIDVADT